MEREMERERKTKAEQERRERERERKAEESAKEAEWWKSPHGIAEAERIANLPKQQPVGWGNGFTFGQNKYWGGGEKVGKSRCKYSKQKHRKTIRNRNKKRRSSIRSH